MVGTYLPLLESWQLFVAVAAVVVAVVAAVVDVAAAVVVGDAVQRGWQGSGLSALPPDPVVAR